MESVAGVGAECVSLRCKYTESLGNVVFLDEADRVVGGEDTDTKKPVGAAEIFTTKFFVK
ncbi:hypothetical protein SARC_02828 [Sphaeroforma arctica JP610]|uniref:Uncharacterized protein n=1 Tax=Sphaeroforma arctica JP610 TaxID=667725 RepID=A0A0L0G9N1_9EUKA|nr:hypothetical protein SARC_02828 [Sphaeroforma arctica JP610]KNC84973.1 hypothetical protein SARC_02828 [Sphaeroforma arctica JP610]|eukprot:XP_014158875.1 hypothetical protein SARC_02828 [Sphaeroforma arctica JP610]